MLQMQQIMKFTGVITYNVLDYTLILNINNYAKVYLSKLIT